MTYSPNDKQKEIIKILCGFRPAFPNSKVDSDTMLIYAYALLDMDTGVLYAAMTKILHTCKFFPSVAEIRATAEEMLQFSNKSSIPYRRRSLGRGATGNTNHQPIQQQALDILLPGSGTGRQTVRPHGALQASGE